METKIMLLLAMVALAVGYCEGLPTIHGDEWAERYDRVKVDRHLSERFDPDTREVARLLTETKNKFFPLEASKGVKVQDLLKLVSRFNYCNLASFTDFEKWRKLFSGPEGNVYLFKYVDENMRRIFQVCTNNINGVFMSEASTNSPEGRISARISQWVDSSGEKTDPQEKTVRDFLEARVISEADRKDLIDGCARLVPRVEKSLAYFMKDDKLAADYLSNLSDFPQALLYKRCKAVNKKYSRQ